MSAAHKKILFIVHHRLNRSPGQRYRFEQYLPYLKLKGVEYKISPLIINAEEDFFLYQSRSVLHKAVIFFKAVMRRLIDVFRAWRYDYVFIYREAFLTGSVFFEKLLKLSGAKIILDFDDAIWLPDISEANKKLSFLKRPEKINDIIRLSSKVIVGNTYLANYVKPLNPNVYVFPSTIDLNYYSTLHTHSDKTSPVIIGWSGSHTTIKHFETIIPVLKKIKHKHGRGVKIVVYGESNYKNDDFEVEAIAWSHETEVKTISSFDIGIMPLPNNQWSQGKCAMKGLQYMGLGVAAILSPVGMNKDVIVNGVNGYLADTEEEWIDRIEELIADSKLRERLGYNGRKTIEEKFSCQVKSDEYLNLLLQ